ncbi:cyclopropane fatty acyl phospholipid synthase [Salinicola halophilus]|uniref:cyclopropane fatty acyl phospholipid synthase n=1 Tax=Salinicola halophilus TaxID=184065 RepID=UPI000DA116F1|nr:cyclopropane fatty acyl phospholipid synthase [Salinicola halophilus]
MTHNAPLAPVALPNTRARQTIEQWLQGADVVLNGDRPWDIRIHHPDLFARVLKQGSIGFGEAYMDGWWESDRLDETLHRLLRNGLGDAAHTPTERILYKLHSNVINLQSRARAYIVGREHYDLGNDLFTRMLDETMCYSCGYWKQADTLHDAQIAKLDLACRKLGLEPGMTVLDIGCGWGSFAEYAARHYGVEVTGITISEAQATFGRKRCQGLPVEIKLEDYRDLEGQFDRIVSIGMFEHVGPRNYAVYFDTVKRLLASEGLFLLHTIGKSRNEVSADPWLNKYIFPNGVLPSVQQIADGYEGKLVMEDWQNFGADYDTTLMAWQANLLAHWDEISDRYDERVKRMFLYYLGSCAGAFRARSVQLWQVVFSDARRGRYDSPR